MLLLLLPADDPRDAEEAVRRRDGYDFYGYRLRVEVARGGSGLRAPPARSTGFRCLVKGLPRTASWQDLKVCKRIVQRMCVWRGGACRVVQCVQGRCGRERGVVHRTKSSTAVLTFVCSMVQQGSVKRPMSAERWAYVKMVEGRTINPRWCFCHSCVQNHQSKYAYNSW